MCPTHPSTTATKLAGDSLCSVCDKCGIYNRIMCHELILWDQHQAGDLTNKVSLSAMWHPNARTYTLWRQDVGAGSHQHLVDSKEKWRVGDQLAAPLPFQDFVETTVTSEGSWSRQSAARQAAPQNILEEEKYHVGTNNIPERHVKRAALFMSAPPAVVIQGSTKSTLCCVWSVSLCFRALWRSLFDYVPQNNGGSTQSQ